MGPRLFVFLVASAAVAGFAALNWAEFMRPIPLNFLLIEAVAPLGLVLLVMLGITLLTALISSATHRTQNLLDARGHSKALQVQRDLAEKAEASRFTDLRQHLDAQLRENRQHEALAEAEFVKAVTQSHHELQVQMNEMNRTLISRLGDIEYRLDPRSDRTRTTAIQAPREGNAAVVLPAGRQ